MQTIICNTEKKASVKRSVVSRFPATYLTVVHIYLKEQHTGILLREGLERLKWKVHEAELELVTGSQHSASLNGNVIKVETN